MQVSNISGRGWKLLAQKMGLSAPNICCLSERYLCPGQALLNWYLGYQVSWLDGYQFGKLSNTHPSFYKPRKFFENESFFDKDVGIVI